MKNRKIILEEKDIQEFEILINNLPCFAKTVGENMSVSQSVQGLMQWMGGKIVESDNPIGGGGGSSKPPKSE